jgi:hypothetical protein
MSRNRELVDLEMHKHFNTEKAILVSLDGDRDKAVWLPFSQIEVMPKHGSIVEITLPVGLAEEKGLV